MNSESTHVHDTAVDISKLFEAEQTGAMSRVIECEALYKSVSGHTICVLSIDSQWWHKLAQLLRWLQGLVLGCKSRQPCLRASIEGDLPSVKLQSIEIGRHCKSVWYSLWFGSLVDAN